MPHCNRVTMDFGGFAGQVPVPTCARDLRPPGLGKTQERKSVVALVGEGKDAHSDNRRPF